MLWFKNKVQREWDRQIRELDDRYRDLITRVTALPATVWERLPDEKAQRRYTATTALGEQVIITQSLSDTGTDPGYALLLDDKAVAVWTPAKEIFPAVRMLRTYWDGIQAALHDGAVEAPSPTD